MELKGKEELRNEILQYWLRCAWVYPFEGPDERTYLRLTPGGRLKIRRRIGELERSLGVDGAELARQDEAGTETRCCADGRGTHLPLCWAPHRRHPWRGGVLTIAVLGFPGGARSGQGGGPPAKTREGGPLKQSVVGRVEAARGG
jgi:hypothetical protein